MNIPNYDKLNNRQRALLKRTGYNSVERIENLAQFLNQPEFRNRRRSIESNAKYIEIIKILGLLEP